MGLGEMHPLDALGYLEGDGIKHEISTSKKIIFSENPQFDELLYIDKVPYRMTNSVPPITDFGKEAYLKFWL